MSESTHDGANCLDFGVPTEWQGLTPRNFDGPVTAPTQRGTIVPAYLTEASDHWVERVRRVLENSLERKSVNRVVNSIRKPQNGLFDELVSTVYDPVRGTYLCFAKNVYLDRKHQGEVINALAGGWAKFQQKLPLFTNAFSACELVDGAYSGPAPKHRIINCGQVVMTVEWDLREPYFLDQQIRWSIAGSDRKCHLDRLYASLSRFRDFRLLEAVWSGHKSVHLHILVDSRHLNPGRFSGEFPRSPGLVDDIPNALFRDGVQKSSELLAPEIMRELGLDLPPDETLHQPDRFRRTPWGIRSLDVDNIFGAPAVTQVPQVVLWSKGRAYARAGDDWLLQPERFLEVARQRRRPFSGSRAAPTLEPELARGFVSELAKLCERIFGPKESAPFPVSVDKGSNGWRIRFLNNLNDHSAGSVMEGHHYTILMGSQDPVIRSKRYSFPLSADELVERYMHTGTLGTSFPMSQHHWSEIQFRQALEWYNSDKPEAVDSPDNPASPWGLNRSKPDAGGRIPTVPDFILQDNVQEAANAERSVTVSMPGAGKTHALIRRMLDEDFDPDRRGYRVIACSSYQQAVSKMEEFRREFGNTRQAVLVRAFNDVYKEQSADGRLGMDAAARLGCHSVIEAVYATAPDTAAVLDRYKRDVARQLGFDEDGDLDYGIRDNVIVFCVHSLIHKWSWAGGTKNWLHPLFDSWREAKLSGEWADVAAIQDVIDHDMRLLWVLYDEISMSDLIVHHRKQDVDSVHQFIDSMDRFDDLKPDELLEAWISHTHSNSGGVPFDLMREIAALAYDKGNLITLDPTREPYGMNNTPDGLYTSAKGCEHYAKTQNWWDHLRCRLTVTTTEQKPRLAIQRIADQQRARNAAQQARAEQSGRPWKPRSVWSTRTYDPANYMPQECMRAQIYLDTGARAPRDGQGEHRSVTSIHEEIRQTCPDAWIISNIIEGARVLTPRKAKGSNDLIGQKVFYVPMFLAGARYADLLIENEILNMGCAVQLDYLDEFDQMAGRTLGFRFRPGSEFVAIVSPRLWSQIAHTICLESRFRLERITARPW